ncbi:MAG TPA: hypothetical protein VNI61_11290 [Gemmatimonadales bacterium]|nr:hypothetical protein [Gemmatimonadales bacterium]
MIARGALALAVCLAGSRLLGQAAPEAPRPYAERALEKLGRRLEADPALQAVGASDQPLEGFTPAVLVRLNDATMAAFARALAATLARAEGACQEFLNGGAEGFLAILAVADSATVDVWLSVIEQAVYAQAFDWPELPVVDAEEWNEFVEEVLMSLPEVDRRRLTVLAGRAGPADYCWFFEVVLGAVAELPVARAGPVMRAIFAATDAEP